MQAKNISSNVDYLADHNSPTTVAGYDLSKFNALKHGVLSKYAVTEWENKEEYQTLVNSLVDEYAPQSLTEEHLVEELANIIWRKMRLKYAEITSLQASLNKQVERDADYRDNYSAKNALLVDKYKVEKFNIREILQATDDEIREELVIIKAAFNCCLTSKNILLESNLYKEGLEALIEEDQEQWKTEWLGQCYEYNRDKQYGTTAKDLLCYVNEIEKYYEKRIFELESREKVKKQILGQSFLSDSQLSTYSRYENHLDKKFEKTLAMLLKLKELRVASEAKTLP